MHPFICFVEKKKCTICTERQVLLAAKNQMSSNEKRRYMMASGFRQYIAEYTVANFDIIQSDVALHTRVH